MRIALLLIGYFMGPYFGLLDNTKGTLLLAIAILFAPPVINYGLEKAGIVSQQQEPLANTNIDTEVNIEVSQQQEQRANAETGNNFNIDDATNKLFINSLTGAAAIFSSYYSTLMDNEADMATRLKSIIGILSTPPRYLASLSWVDAAVSLVAYVARIAGVHLEPIAMGVIGAFGFDWGINGLTTIEKVVDGEPMGKVSKENVNAITTTVNESSEPVGVEDTKNISNVVEASSVDDLATASENLLVNKSDGEVVTTAERFFLIQLFIKLRGVYNRGESLTKIYSDTMTAIGDLSTRVIENINGLPDQFTLAMQSIRDRTVGQMDAFIKELGDKNDNGKITWGSIRSYVSATISSMKEIDVKGIVAQPALSILALMNAIKMHVLQKVTNELTKVVKYKVAKFVGMLIAFLLTAVGVTFLSKKIYSRMTSSGDFASDFYKRIASTDGKRFVVSKACVKEYGAVSLSVTSGLTELFSIVVGSSDDQEWRQMKRIVDKMNNDVVKVGDCGIFSDVVGKMLVEFMDILKANISSQGVKKAEIVNAYINMLQYFGELIEDFGMIINMKKKQSIEYLNYVSDIRRVTEVQVLEMKDLVIAFLEGKVINTKRPAIDYDTITLGSATEAAGGIIGSPVIQ